MAEGSAVPTRRTLRPAGWQAPRRWAAPAVDALLTVALGLLALATLRHGAAGDPAAWWVSAGLVLPLLARRSAPVAALSVMGVFATVQLVLGLRLVADLALLLTLYTVASTGSRRTAFRAAAALEVFAVAAAVRIGPSNDGRLASLLFTSGLIAAALFAGRSVQERRAYLASVLDRADRLEREQAQRAQLAVTEERNRIAREMHDIVAHSLSLMTSLADAARAANGDPEQPASKAMGQVAATGRDAMSQMRRLLGVLRDDVRDSEAGGTPLGPQPDLAHLDLLVDSARAAGLPARLTTSGEPALLPAAMQTTVYRIVQESLTNVVKHARDPHLVTVALTWSDEELTLRVEDDGARAGEGGGPAGHGLIGMRERVAVFDGSLTAGPKAHGWRVQVRLPLPAAGPP